MNNIKKFFAVLIAMTMAMVLAVPAFAQGSITNTSKTHSYVVYQLFTGDYDESADNLSNVKWGANANGVTVGDAVPESTLATIQGLTGTDAEKLAAIEPYVDFTGEAAYTIAAATESAPASIDVADGYYVIKDVDGSQEGEDEAYTTHLVQVVGGELTITPKSATPTVDKQVLDEVADAEDGSTNGWGETADHAINESFQFKLIATLPADADLDSYAHYQLVFNDTMSAGITYEGIESVTVGEKTLASDQYTVAGIAEGDKGAETWSLTIDDLKALGDKAPASLQGLVVTVIYNAHLNEEATLNDTTNNNNKVDLEYSNNPTWNGEGTPDKGKTPEDTVWVFTYEMDNTKVDGSNNNTALGGAGFTLYDTNDHEIPLIYDASMEAYRPIKDGETGVEMMSAETTGKFDIKGLDAGTYVLKETTVPGGYNKCDDITVKIAAKHAETSATQAKTVITLTNTADGSDYTGTIVNKKGTTLPSTGGMGTTLFTILGIVLMGGAAVLLVAKRRTNK